MRSLLISVLVITLFFAGRYLYMKPKFMIGIDAPNFEAELMDKSTFQFNDFLKDKIVLLDFWGSWCGPCRAENPNLVKLYREFHGQQFENYKDFDIVSIGIETDEHQWKNAIEKDQLIWQNHIAQLDRFSSPIATLYGVREIPTSYLINGNGKIIGVNMTYIELKKLLQSKLTSK